MSAPESDVRRIGVIAHELEGDRTGVGRYLEGLLQGLLESDDSSYEWHFFFRGDPFAHPLWPDPDHPPAGWALHFDRRPDAKTILWEQLRLPSLLRRVSLDAVFSPAYSLPPRLGVPGLVTIHDLSFERLPEEFAWKERWRRRLLARRAARTAARVIVDTGPVKREMAQTYRVPDERLAVIPLAVDQAVLTGEPDDDEPRLADLGIEFPYLLSLGSLLPRRNIPRLIEVFSALAQERPRLRLVLAGADRLRDPALLQRLIDTSGVADRILRLGYVPEEALGALYRRAELTFYLSDYEGYGLPPLESLAAGTATVIGDGLALDDIWPDYPLRCSDFELATVLETARVGLDDSGLRRKIEVEGIERVARLTWAHSAQMLCREIDAVVGRDSRREC